ncbi:hypothetical protein [Pseudoalteromonas luteoviolacea]|uniref:Uncharacterized protein n=1 Tax=Pseudoalteromonas luteoviolacea S4054 TaxID=1129367 RepID=A0A0F6A6X0_9GAMM|nr:hypothetical protein [Pseudoalteromonas luteoviolacea]AOT07734.1 hypothetical protein S4054249_07710 [Pseudoalteromonas luteoviolacea]AOT12650.1 hypothetical protein S40542_07710 [Pseudoalteromonas luteoviolacea]AOT17563.1 hypothetical protein S4054_07705 [Pseudoalteromonas luteoviolacea]KKE81601.1 hypothetical protein N479_22145 [Pseudoalteromonas luteoviolacea S4054]KZN78863.1 hypothetical protein N481_00040 [Pseudoalteromonas luteoviolacea S4047-1]
MIKKLDGIFIFLVLLGGVGFGITVFATYMFPENINFLNMPKEFSFDQLSWPTICLIYFLTGVINVCRVMEPTKIICRLCILANILSSIYAISLSSLSLPVIFIPAWINTWILIMMTLFSVCSSIKHAQTPAMQEA